MKKVKIDDVEFGGARRVLVAGPCAIESEDMAMETAQTLAEITDKLNIPFVFKASYDKANRLSIESGRGLGFPKGLLVLRSVREKVGVPVLTDVHETYQVEAAASIADILQIPAFLCRQTDLVVSAASTGKAINIKKGQFLAPQDMQYIAQKALSTGNDKIILTERGSSFGYHDIVFDPRSIVIMKDSGYPVLVDATHLCQQPGAGGGKTSGNRRFSLPFAKVAFALDADGIYMEVHPDPQNAISDKDVQIPLNSVEDFLKTLDFSR